MGHRGSRTLLRQKVVKTGKGYRISLFLPFLTDFYHSFIKAYSHSLRKLLQEDM